MKKKNHTHVTDVLFPPVPVLSFHCLRLSGNPDWNTGIQDNGF